jgi:hypothetical protein
MTTLDQGLIAALLVAPVALMTVDALPDPIGIVAAIVAAGYVAARTLRP